MKSNQHLIAGILAKYVRREPLGKKEMHLLETWWQESEEHIQFTEMLQDGEVVRRESEEDPHRSARMWKKMSERLDEANIAMVKKRAFPVADFFTNGLVIGAAALLLVGFVAVYLFHLRSRDESVEAVVKIDSKGLRRTADSMVLFTRIDGTQLVFDTLPIGGVLERYADDVLRRTDTNSVGWDMEENTRRYPETVNGSGMKAGKHFVLSGLVVGANHSPVNIRLPDSSQACLSPGTGLALDFDEHARRITLDNPVKLDNPGKTFFDIQPDKHWPCLINAPNSTTIAVLGTSFQVEVSMAKRETRVTLINGELKVSGDSGSVRLSNTSREALVSRGRPEITDLKDTATVAGWAQKTLFFHFDHTELSEVLRQVACWYGCTIENAGKVQGKPIIGDIVKSPSLEDVLKVIRATESQEVKLEREGRVIKVLHR